MQNKELDNLYLNYEEEPAQILMTQERMPDNRDAARERSKQQRNRNNRIRGWMGILVGVLIGMIICLGAFGVLAVRSNATNIEMDYETKIELILSYLETFYLNDLDDEMIENALAKGLLQNIGDKYAEYYSPEEFEDLMEQMNGEYAGIGVQITMNDEGKVEVYKVFRDTPAEEAGIQIRDYIVEAAGQRDFETLDDLVAIVRGPEGTQVDIVIERNGEEIPMTVERRKIETESIYSEMLSDTVGYILISEFNASTVSQFFHAIDSLQEQGMTSVIMDLRDNPGGDYDSVVAMCDRVLPEGVIVSVEDKQGGIITENSDATCLDIPIVLLVNSNTASAAELFTMALHDYDMAQVVGTTTYGKGIVQSIFRLLDGSGLKFTTEKYYGPKGNYIQDTGIEPDFVLEFPEEVYEDGIITREEDIQLQKAAELLGLELTFEETKEAELAE